MTIYKEKYGIEVYNAPNGILVADSNYYSQYESVEDFEKVLSERGNPVKGREIMFKKNEFGKDFPQHTKELIKILFNALSFRMRSLIYYYWKKLKINWPRWIIPCFSTENIF